MAQSLGLHRRPSYLGLDYIDFQHRRRQAPVHSTASLSPIEAPAPDVPWWQQLFPFLADWLPWIIYYRDLAVYHVQKILYLMRYLFAYCLWMMDRYQEAVQFQIQRFLYELDGRLQRWAEEIEGD